MPLASEKRESFWEGLKPVIPTSGPFLAGSLSSFRLVLMHCLVLAALFDSLDTSMDG